MSMPQATRNRLLLSAIAVLFFAPLLLAVLMQSQWWNFEPGTTTNLGKLLDPPVALDAAALRESLAAAGNATEDGRATWLMLYVFPGDCAQGCQDDVSGLRQAHLALGRHREAATVALLSSRPIDAATRAQLQKIYPGFAIIRDDWDTLRAGLAEAVQRIWPGTSDPEDHAFLIDPQGHIILAYAPGFDPNHVYQDLRHLLRYASRD